MSLFGMMHAYCDPDQHIIMQPTENVAGMHYGASRLRLRLSTALKNRAFARRLDAALRVFQGFRAGRPHAEPSLPTRFALRLASLVGAAPALRAGTRLRPTLNAGRVSARIRSAALGRGCPRASLRGRGALPPTCHRPAGAGAGLGTGRAPAPWTGAPLRGCVQRPGTRPPPAFALGRSGAQAGRLRPGFAGPPSHASSDALTCCVVVRCGDILCAS